jgi:hypothetical protein
VTQLRKAVAQPQIDREKLRAAIRRMGSDYLFLMVDAAITVLTQDSLRMLVKGFLNPDELQSDGKEEMSLLENVKAFRKVSLQGKYLRGFRCQFQELRHDLKRNPGLDGRLPPPARRMCGPGEQGDLRSAHEAFGADSTSWISMPR